MIENVLFDRIVHIQETRHNKDDENKNRYIKTIQNKRTINATTKTIKIKYKDKKYQMKRKKKKDIEGSFKTKTVRKKKLKDCLTLKIKLDKISIIKRANPSFMFIYYFLKIINLKYFSKKTMGM